MMMIINHGNKSIALQAMRARLVAKTGSAAKTVPAMPQSQLEQTAQAGKEMNNMNETIKDGYEAQHIAQEAIFAEEGHKYCEVCGAELEEGDAFLCIRCDLSRRIDD